MPINKVETLKSRFAALFICGHRFLIMVNAVKARLIAATVHFLITLCFAAAAWVLIFLIWFPHPFEQMVGGEKLFYLVLGCDLVLGPLLSLVIFNRKKTRRHLVIDYTIVATVQIAALIYGIYVVSESRPVVIAFVKDRLEVITAIEFEAEDLKEAASGFKRLPLFGPQHVYVELPSDVQDRNDALFLALRGRDISVRPKYYRDYDSRINLIKTQIQPLSLLFQRKSEAKSLIDEAITASDLNVRGWLPVKHRFGFWTALVDENARPIAYVPVDPY